MQAETVRAIYADPELPGGLVSCRPESQDGHLATAAQRLAGAQQEASAGPARALELERDLGEGLGLALGVDAVLLGVGGTSSPVANRPAV